MFDRVDGRLLEGLYGAISVETDTVRALIDERRLSRVDPSAERVPSLEELQFTAERVIADMASTVGAMGGVAGLGGLLTLPPEATAWMVAVVRLAQRLAIVYGFDPETDRGRMAISQAIAAALEVELPAAGVSGMRVSELFGMAGNATPDARAAGTMLVRAMALRTARMMFGRIGRLVPLVSSGVSAVDNHRQLVELGGRMTAVYSRIVELPARLMMIEDAVEL